MADRDPQLDLKKRARRRLVGAAALALLAAIVLPLVMDQEPKPLSQDVQVRIPNPDAPGSSLVAPRAAAPAASPAPAAAPTAPAAKAADAPAAVSAPVEKPADKVPEKPADKAADKAPVKPEPKVVEKPAAKPDKQTSEAARAEAILNGEEPAAKKPETAGGKFIVQIGVYSDAGNVKRLREKIKSEGYNSLVEPVQTEKGTKTRVKAGPFASKEAAQKARDKLKRIGLDGVVAAKP